MWTKFIALMMVVSAAAFLNLQVKDEDKTQAAMMRMVVEQHTMGQQHSMMLVSQPATYPASPTTATDDTADHLSTHGIVLGTLCLAVAVAAWFTSLYDYFHSIFQLEKDRVYLDEIDGRPDPVVATVSITISLTVLGIAIYLLAVHGQET